MKISLAVHLVGLVMWLGGLMILTRCMKVFTQNFSADAEAGIAPLRALVRRTYFGFVLPGLLLSLASGVYQIVSGGIKVYMAQGWFHGKLTVLLILFAVTVMVGMEVKKAASGATLSAKKLIVLHAVSATCLIAIAFLTMVLR